MLFDNILQGYISYSLFVVLFLLVLKLGVTFWYKPTSAKFVFKSFFRVYPKITIFSKENRNPKWKTFKKTHNFLTITFYSLFGLWAILYFIIVLPNKK